MLTQLSTKRRGGFTLVEIMIVVAIIALLAAIAVPSFLRARERSQAATILNNLRLLDAGKDQWALESSATSGATTVMYDATGGPGGSPTGVALYLKEGTPLRVAAEAAGVASTMNDPKFTDPQLIYDLRTIGVRVNLSANPFNTDIIPDEYYAGYSINGVDIDD